VIDRHRNSAQFPDDSSELNSRQVLFRILFRLVLLIAFATFGSQGFGQTFNALLALSAVFCIVAGAMRREAIFGPTLTHWDEAAVYAVADHVVRSVV
jgi:hypothetical protein